MPKGSSAAQGRDERPAGNGVSRSRTSRIQVHALREDRPTTTLCFPALPASLARHFGNTGAAQFRTRLLERQAKVLAIRTRRARPEQRRPRGAAWGLLAGAPTGTASNPPCGGSDSLDRTGLRLSSRELGRTTVDTASENRRLLRKMCINRLFLKLSPVQAVRLESSTGFRPHSLVFWHLPFC